ncbi:Protein PIN-LIKES 1 [Linum grandiflorum]
MAAGRILDLLVASLMPVLKLLIVTGVGSFLAVDAVDILGVEARKHLNNVVFYVFSPALVGSSLAKYMTLKNVLLMWFMPLNILFTFIVGSLLGWILIRVTRPPRALRGVVLGCCAAGNLGNMLLIILPAVCHEKGSPFGDVETCNALGLAYGSVSLAVGVVYMWSYIYYIMRLYATTTPETEAGDTTALEGLPKSSPPGHTGLELVPMVVSSPHKEKETDQQGHTGLELVPVVSSQQTDKVIQIGADSVKVMKAPLRVVQESAALLGDAAIPTITLLVGANLVKGLKGSEVRPPVIAGIIVIRYIALPLTGVGIVKSAIRMGLVHQDPLYRFVLLLQFAVPPAINIGTISQLFGTGESECSVILLASFALASVAVTIWSAIFMWMVA